MALLPTEGAASGMRMVESLAATVVCVAYRTPAVDLSWVPDGTPVIVVHNDDQLDEASLPSATHVHSRGNVGFGAAVNRALAMVQTRRFILCNPDARLQSAHWDALVDGAGRPEIMCVPL